MLNSKKFKWSTVALLSFSIFSSPFSYSEETTSTKNEPQKMVSEDPQISTFINLGAAAGLSDIFLGTGPFTGFVPSNEAMAKLGRPKMNQLFDPNTRDQLTHVIKNHIVPGKYLSKNLKSTTYKNLNGKELSVVVENGEIKVNGIKVIRSDLVGPFGVVHVIDGVLLPK
jgi:uncharacterized surface protein with fasciclin (FAS1) repeats